MIQVKLPTKICNTIPRRKAQGYLGFWMGEQELGLFGVIFILLLEELGTHLECL